MAPAPRPQGGHQGRMGDAGAAAGRGRAYPDGTGQVGRIKLRAAYRRSGGLRRPSMIRRTAFALLALASLAASPASAAPAAHKAAAGASAASAGGAADADLKCMLVASALGQNSDPK